MPGLCKNIFILTLLTLLAGCAQNYYNIPRETYEKRVRILGVAPLMLDADSDIRHPEKGEVVRIIREANRKNEKELVNLIKNSGEYFAVRFLDEEPDQLFATVVSRRERRDDAGVVYNKYFYKPEEIRKLIEKHSVDAILLVKVSGISQLEKIYSNTFLAYLEENYNNIIMTAQIVDKDSVVLWEYPNFRQRALNYSRLFALQYPDFEEARANLTDQVKVKFKSVPGINRGFTASESSSIKGKEVSVIYNKQFADMSSLLQYFRNPFAEKTPQKKVETEKVQAMEPFPAPKSQPLSEPVSPEGKPAQSTPAPIQMKPAPRQLEPARTLDPSAEIIREPEIR